MKRIGLIGGMSWHSSAIYYQYINEEINSRLGEQHSADIIMISLDFESLIVPWQQGKWAETTDPIKKAAHQLEKSGADFFLICSNTIHKFATEISESTKLPLLHIGTITSEKIYQEGIKTVGFLGTKICADSDFYKLKLEEKNITMIRPNEEEQLTLDEIIFSELTKGVLNQNAQDKIGDMINNLKNNGAEGVILGCTELPLIISQDQFEIPLFDSLRLHALSAVEKCLSSPAASL